MISSWKIMWDHFESHKFTYKCSFRKRLFYGQMDNFINAFSRWFSCQNDVGRDNCSYFKEYGEEASNVSLTKVYKDTIHKRTPNVPFFLRFVDSSCIPRAWISKIKQMGGVMKERIQVSGDSNYRSRMNWLSIAFKRTRFLLDFY